MQNDMVSYPAVLTPLENDHFLISFPDIPGAFATAPCLSDAFSLAVDTLGSALLDRPNLPLPSDPPKNQFGPDGSLTILISVDLTHVA
ncbi:type II toxin-antitoxin system HicB family antitoxin [Secundilactobacillus malefermentans]|uniref:HicB-like antitoxin of toxin-antitoxin system domain-containing protein n=2 Tax=Secundilactobacillus malefermentans TaxID=176292 RepID=A0A4R5NCJ6_9LACO|nr:type II toxin-antitoxin system HicB family antitoxin [Secundilactobacillus malefermentans]KRM56749.1 hypothetical protein FD44_GL001552 [Secundilactobacillus malefermentans DSM 5705 = KCTC 3548]QEA31795.1 type II toxin-antitoxin system HicB family antitoxin [Secundilactobacillus malefermentans]TDG70843.1 hypothetical protein C5L31_000411 [Secundilactobacillus malefermentans]